MSIDKDLALMITSSEIGAGEQDLGARLTELLFKVFSESKQCPAKMIFINSGVFLTTEGSPVVDALRKLEEHGTEITSCTTCLTYFDRMEKVVVGKRSDMKDTVSALTHFTKVITL